MVDHVLTDRSGNRLSKPAAAVTADDDELGLPRQIGESIRSRCRVCSTWSNRQCTIPGHYSLGKSKISFGPRFAVDGT